MHTSSSTFISFSPLLHPITSISTILSHPLPAASSIFFFFPRSCRSRLDSPGSSIRPVIKMISSPPGAGTPMEGASPGVSAAPSANGGALVRVVDEMVCAGEAVTILYTPPRGYFKKGSALLYAGGFNGWNGNEQPFIQAMLPQDENTYRCSIAVTNDAQSIDFSFTDGLRFDTNNGHYYHIPVRFQMRLNEQGKLEVFDANNLNDDRQSKYDLLNKKHVDVQNKNQPDQPLFSIEKERDLHQIRAEAATAGNAIGLGNMQITDARIAFERFARGLSLPVENIKDSLEELDFDLDATQIEQLIQKYVKDPLTCSMTEFTLLYGELENSDYGIEMV